MMRRKSLIIVVTVVMAAVTAGVLLAGVSHHYDSHASTADSYAYKVLHDSKRAVENLESMRADAYFFNYVDTGRLKEHSKCYVSIEMLRVENESRRMKIEFKDYEYECSDAFRNLAYERLRESLRDAWILDTTDKFYVYSPALRKSSVTEFAPRQSLMRYEFIPLIDPLHLAEMFDSAENASYEGIQSVNMWNTTFEAHVISYELHYPLVRFADKATLRTWISTADHMPLKTEAHAVYITADGNTTKIRFEFGFERYEKGVHIPPENLSLPALRIIKRG